MSSKFSIYLNAGHGDYDKEKDFYHTFPHDGKRYEFVNENGATIAKAFEGQTNRIFANKLKDLLEAEPAFEVIQIHHDKKDLYNFQRVQKANDHFLSKCGGNSKKALWVSFHSNAFANSFKGVGTGATGIEFWTSLGKTLSDTFAGFWHKEVKSVMQNYKIVDRGIKEANFDELVNTFCPAVLIENLFFTNLNDYNLLLNENYQNEIALATFNAIKKYFEHLSQ